jgi:hypothetical protein
LFIMNQAAMSTGGTPINQAIPYFMPKGAATSMPARGPLASEQTRARCEPRGRLSGAPVRFVAPSRYSQAI